MPPPTTPDALLEQLAVIARSLGADVVELHGGHREQRALSRRLLNAGARRTRHVIGYDGERPYVIDRAALPSCGLVIAASAPARTASPGERAALDSGEAFYYLGSYRAVEMIDVDVD